MGFIDFLIRLHTYIPGFGPVSCRLRALPTLHVGSADLHNCPPGTPSISIRWNANFRNQRPVIYPLCKDGQYILHDSYSYMPANYLTCRLAHICPPFLRAAVHIGNRTNQFQIRFDHTLAVTTESRPSLLLCQISATEIRKIQNGHHWCCCWSYPRHRKLKWQQIFKRQFELNQIKKFHWRAHTIWIYT